MTQSDLIARLRLYARHGVMDVTWMEYKDACSEAADLIERLSPPLDPLHDALMSSVKVRKVLSPPLDGEGVIQAGRGRAANAIKLALLNIERDVRVDSLTNDELKMLADAALATISTPREDEASKFIDKAYRLIANPGDGVSVFTIRVGEPNSQMNVRAGKDVDPRQAIDDAIGVLLAERGDLDGCPHHAAREQRMEEALRHALTFIENRYSDLSPEKRSTVGHIRSALSLQDKT